VDGDAAGAFEVLAGDAERILATRDGRRLFVRVARLADAQERALGILSKEGVADGDPVTRAALHMGLATRAADVGAITGADPLDPETLLIAGEVRHRFTPDPGSTASGEAELYVELARRLAASRMATTGDRLRREAALRGYAAAAAELRRALEGEPREAM
jgi:hypothetical protein